MPIGRNMRATMKNVTMTGPGVRIGCQAGSCCCLKRATNQEGQPRVRGRQRAFGVSPSQALSTHHDATGMY